MRPNLTTGFTATGHGRGAFMTRPGKVSAGFAVAVLTILSTAVPAGWAAASDASRALLASSTSQPVPSGCHKADEIKPVLFPKQQVVAYDFTGPDADKLKNVMDVVSAQVAPTAALVRVVLVPSTNEAMAFQFDANGCHTVTIDLDWTQMSHVFESAGVAAPFGPTFYQSPGIAI
jgi:hypothetical protein